MAGFALLARWRPLRRKSRTRAIPASIRIIAPPNFQTISEKTEARDGWLRIGTDGRRWARKGGSLPLDRRESALQDGLPARRLGRLLAMDARRREARLDQSARRGRPVASLLSRAHRRRRVGGRGGDRSRAPRAVPVWWCPTVSPLPRNSERRHLRSARRQAARSRPLLFMPALL